MSWDKNTTTSTKIDDTIEVLRENIIPYKLEILGKVEARGLNDSYTGTIDYVIRKLSYQDFVIMEQMVRNPDCDIDDVIIAEKFEKDNIPENWKIETETEDTAEYVDFEVEIDDLIGDITDITEDE